MISLAGQWTQNPSASPLQPIKWNTSFWIVFTSDDQPGWLMDSNPICHLSPAKNMKFSSLDYIQLLMIGWTGRWTQTPSATPLQPKKWNAHFCITLNFWCWPDWSMDSNPTHHPSPGKKMKCSYFDYVQLLMTGQAGQWTQKKMKCSFLDYVQLLMLARLVNRLEPHPPSLSSQKNEMLIFGLHSTSDDWPGWTMDSNPIHHPSSANKMKSLFLYYVELLMISRAGWWTQTPSANPLQPKKWNPHFWILFNFWWSARLVIGLEPYLPPLSSQKSEMLIFLLQSTSDLGQTGQWTQTPSTTHLQPIKWNACFCITLNFWWLAGMVEGLKPPLPPLSSQKHEMLLFGLCSTSDDRPGWSIDSNPIHHCSPPKKWNAHFWIAFPSDDRLG